MKVYRTIQVEVGVPLPEDHNRVDMQVCGHCHMLDPRTGYCSIDRWYLEKVPTTNLNNPTAGLYLRNPECIAQGK